MKKITKRYASPRNSSSTRNAYTAQRAAPRRTAQVPHRSVGHRNPPGSCPFFSHPLPLPIPPIPASELRSHQTQHRGGPAQQVRSGTPPHIPDIAWSPLAAGRGARISRSGGRGRDRRPPWRAQCRRCSCWTSRAAFSSGATTAATSQRSRPSDSSPSSSTRR
jgi:hypothetical protein